MSPIAWLTSPKPARRLTSTAQPLWPAAGLSPPLGISGAEAILKL